MIRGGFTAPYFFTNAWSGELTFSVKFGRFLAFFANSFITSCYQSPNYLR